MQPVMQQKADVTREYLQNNVKNRVKKLETEISAIKELIFRNIDISDEKTRNNGLELKQKAGARGLGGYDIAFTRRRSPVPITLSHRSLAASDHWIRSRTSRSTQRP